MSKFTIGQVLLVRLHTDEICEAKVTSTRHRPYIEIEFISGRFDGDKISVNEDKIGPSDIVEYA